MFWFIFQLLIPLSFSSQGGFSSHSTSTLKTASTEPVCEGPKENFNWIEDGKEISGNLYACNQFFTNPITTSSLVNMYHCKFTYFKKVPISIESCSTDGNLIFSNCNFYLCSGCIYLSNVKSSDIQISECHFELCSSNSEKCIIQFNSGSGTISECYFLNNKGSTGTGDISYNPSGTAQSTGRLIIKGCTFEKSSTSYTSNFLFLKENSLITFINNNIHIWVGDSKVFANEATNLDQLEIRDNYMFPFESSKIGSSIPEGGISDPDDKLECPTIPEGVTIPVNNLYCANSADPTDNTVLSTYSFIQVYHSIFNQNKNSNGNGGAVCLLIKNQPEIDTKYSIKFYHTVFTKCQAQNGGAFYLESVDTNRLFEFDRCTFDSNTVSKKGCGGGIYIESSVSCFRFTNCLVSSNKADFGGGIYYISDETTVSGDDNVFALQLNDCHLYQNIISDCGGAVYISIKSNASPRPIEFRRCAFIGNKDADGLEPESEYGAAVYYSLVCQSPEAPSDSSTAIDKSFGVYDCVFTYNQITNYGGALCIIVEKNEPYKPIEITECLFNENSAAYLSSECSDVYGGSIYYKLLSSSESTNTNPSLTIHNCRFLNCYSFRTGGSICLSIQNSQSLRSIEIYDCSYGYTQLSDFINLDFDLAFTFYGGFIAYIVDSSYGLENDNPPLHISNCSFSSTIDTFGEEDTFNSYEFGGCIYLQTNNNLQKGAIEINDCTFSNKQKTAEESKGGSIYYISNAATATEPDSIYTVLSISNCEFSDSYTKKNGGSFYIEFDKDNSQIEITNCTFQRTTSEEGKDAIYIRSNKKANTVIFDNCTFESCTVRMLMLSTTFTNSQFNNIESDKYAILYDEWAANSDFSATISFDSCHFVQESQVNSLVYFNTEIKSKFSFTNNIINFTDTDSHVFGCKSGINIPEEEEKWYFLNNAINPEDELVIKTEAAQKIPAFCGKGFTCPYVPKNCEENSRCELKLQDDAEELPDSKELNDRIYYNINTTEYGGAIRFINYPLTCIGSTFTLCKAENGGGGGIYIVVKNSIVTTTYIIEKCEFKECQAKFGGAIYIYNNQQGCGFSIKKCTFEQNVADVTAPTDEANAHLFGGSAIYLQTKTGTILRCTFRKNIGIGVKVFHDDNLEPPNSDISQSSVKLNSIVEPSIEFKECLFEADKYTSSSSLYYAREGKKQFPINVYDCTFIGELPNGSYYIDGESTLNLNDKLKIKIEKCKFASDWKLALNSKLNVMSLDINSQQFNFIQADENASNNNLNHHQIRSDFVLLAVMAVSAIVAISMTIIIIIKKKKYQVDESADNDENATEL